MNSNIREVETKVDTDPSTTDEFIARASLVHEEVGRVAAHAGTAVEAGDTLALGA